MIRSLGISSVDNFKKKMLYEHKSDEQYLRSYRLFVTGDTYLQVRGKRKRTGKILSFSTLPLVARELTHPYSEILTILYGASMNLVSRTNEWLIQLFES